MRRHLQDYSFKSMLRRGDSDQPQAHAVLQTRAGKMTTAYLANVRSSTNSDAAASASVPVRRKESPNVPPLRLPDVRRGAHGSQSSRVAGAARSAAPPHAATSRAHGSSLKLPVEHQGLSDQLARLTAQASHSSRVTGSLQRSIAAAALPRPSLPLLSAAGQRRGAKERRPLWAMAPSIPKLFSSLVLNRGDTGMASVDQRLMGEQAQPDGCEEGGRIGLEHWMEFCRETNAFTKLQVAPSDCIFAFRRGVEAAGSDESALARKVGLVMNLEAFCGCVVSLAELAGALPSHADALGGWLHSVWDCDADTSKACSLLLLKLLTAEPGLPPPKAASLVVPPSPAAACPAPADPPIPHFIASPPKATASNKFNRKHVPLLPAISSPDKHTSRHTPRDAQHFPPVQHPPPRKLSLAFTEEPESSVTSSPSKSKSTSVKSSAPTASPSSTVRHRDAQHRRQRDGLARSSTKHHVVDIATGSEFLRWFRDKLTQIGSDGLTYPVRIVAVEVPLAHFPLIQQVKLTRAQFDRSGRRKNAQDSGLDGKKVVDISLGNQNAVDKYFRQQLRDSS